MGNFTFIVFKVLTSVVKAIKGKWLCYSGVHPPPRWGAHCHWSCGLYRTVQMSVN